MQVTYALTAKGRALGAAAEELERWSHGWVAPARHTHEVLAD